MDEITKFREGETYYTRSLCDYDSIFKCTIHKRTSKSVWIDPPHGPKGKHVMRRIKVIDNVETISPVGTYSMSPTIWADSEISNFKPRTQ